MSHLCCMVLSAKQPQAAHINTKERALIRKESRETECWTEFSFLIFCCPTCWSRALNHMLQLFVSLRLTFLQQPFFPLMCFFHKKIVCFFLHLLCFFLWQISAIMLLPWHVKSFPPHLLLSFNPPPLIPTREQSCRKAHKMCNSDPLFPSQNYWPVKGEGEKKSGMLVLTSDKVPPPQGKQKEYHPQSTQKTKSNK